MATEYKIYPMMNGYFEMDLGGIMSPLCVGAVRKVPIIFYLIEAPDGEKILVDCGYNDKTVPATFKAQPQTEEQKFENLLAAHGLKPEDIQLCIITHLHHDHTGNMTKLKNATFIVQEKELLGSTYPLGNQAIGVAIDDWYPCVPHMRLVDGDLEIRDGIQLVLTPGHTEGHQSVIVNTAKGKAAIMGDTMYMYGGMPERFPDKYEELLQIHSAVAGNQSLEHLHNFFPSLRAGKTPFPQLGCARNPHMRYWKFGPGIAKPGDNMREIEKLDLMADMILPHHDPEVLKMKCIPDDYHMNDIAPHRKRVPDGVKIFNFDLDV